MRILTKIGIGLWCVLSVVVKADDTLRIVTELSPPHQTLEQGEIRGLSTELVRATLKQAQIAGQFEIYPWARAFRIARSQANVLIYNMARTAEREDEFKWIGTVASYQLGFVALTHRDDIQIDSLEQAKGYTVAVQRDDLSANFLLQHGFKAGLQLVQVADIAESWQLLLNGKVDLVIDDPVAMTDMAQSLALPAQYVRFVYPITELAQQTWLAASLNTPDGVVSRLRAAHTEVKKSERYQQIMASRYHRP